RHKLIAIYAVQNDVHHRPLCSGEAPAPLGFCFRQFGRGGPAHVYVQLMILDEDPAPDNIPWLADALERAAAEPEVHRRLALAARLGVTACDMRWRNGAGDLIDPHVVVYAGAFVVLAPANIVESRRGIDMHRGENAIGHQR